MTSSRLSAIAVLFTLHTALLAAHENWEIKEFSYPYPATFYREWTLPRLQRLLVVEYGIAFRPQLKERDFPRLCEAPEEFIKNILIGKMKSEKPAPAAYDPIGNIIYVASEWKDGAAELIAHEFVHYLLANSDNREAVDELIEENAANAIQKAFAKWQKTKLNNSPSYEKAPH